MVVVVVDGRNYYQHFTLRIIIYIVSFLEACILRHNF
jgi:hypothetical protein